MKEVEQRIWKAKVAELEERQREEKASLLELQALKMAEAEARWQQQVCVARAFLCTLARYAYCGILTPHCLLLFPSVRSLTS